MPFGAGHTKKVFSVKIKILKRNVVKITRRDTHQNHNNKKYAHKHTPSSVSLLPPDLLLFSNMHYGNFDTHYGHSVSAALYIRGLECTIFAQRGGPGGWALRWPHIWPGDIEQTTGRFSHTPPPPKKKECRRPVGRGGTPGRHPGRKLWMCCKAAAFYVVKAALGRELLVQPHLAGVAYLHISLYICSAWLACLLATSG